MSENTAKRQHGRFLLQGVAAMVHMHALLTRPTAHRTSTIVKIITDTGPEM